jgi:hypothetical protein
VQSWQDNKLAFFKKFRQIMRYINLSIKASLATLKLLWSVTKESARLVMIFYLVPNAVYCLIGGGQLAIDPCLLANLRGYEVHAFDALSKSAGVRS